MNAYSITVKHSCSLCSLILHTLIATVYLYSITSNMQHTTEVCGCTMQMLHCAL